MQNQRHHSLCSFSFCSSWLPQRVPLRGSHWQSSLLEFRTSLPVRWVQLFWSYIEVFTSIGGTQSFPSPNLTFNYTCLSRYMPKQLGTVDLLWTVQRWHNYHFVFVGSTTTEGSWKCWHLCSASEFPAGQHQWKPGWTRNALLWRQRQPTCISVPRFSVCVFVLMQLDLKYPGSS